MAIVSFWSSRDRETNQTISMVSSAIQMGIERNLKCLIVDANFNDDTIKRCFSYGQVSAFAKSINRGKVDVSAGVEGLLTAVNSNATSPEIVKNYTNPILKNRLDVLDGLRTTQRSVYENSIEFFPEMLNLANKYYDIIYVDLEKDLESETVIKILAMSDLIVVTMDQDLQLIEDFRQSWGVNPLFSPKDKVIPLLTKEDSFSTYNCDNVARRIGMKPGMPSVVYNTLVMERSQVGKLDQLLVNFNISSPTGRNRKLLETLSDLNMLIVERLEMQKYEGSKGIGTNKMSIKEKLLAHKKFRDKNEENLLDSSETGTITEEIEEDESSFTSDEDKTQEIENLNVEQVQESLAMAQQAVNIDGDDPLKEEAINPVLQNINQEAFIKAAENVINAEGEIQEQPIQQSQENIEINLEVNEKSKQTENINKDSKRPPTLQEQRVEIEKQKHEDAYAKYEQELKEQEEVTERKVIMRGDERIHIGGIDFSNIKPLSEEKKEKESQEQQQEQTQILQQQQIEPQDNQQENENMTQNSNQNMNQNINQNINYQQNQMIDEITGRVINTDSSLNQKQQVQELQEKQINNVEEENIQVQNDNIGINPILNQSINMQNNMQYNPQNNQSLGMDQKQNIKQQDENNKSKNKQTEENIEINTEEDDSIDSLI